MSELQQKLLNKYRNNHKHEEKLAKNNWIHVRYSTMSWIIHIRKSSEAIH